MPTPAFCALEDVYADWDFKKPNQTPNILQPQSNQGHGDSQTGQYPQLHPVQKPASQPAFQQSIQEDEDTSYVSNNNGLRSFCPNCQNCVKANDVLQQRIIEQNIWPRPRWEPQYPHAYSAYDPFNRYWMNNVPQDHISGINGREDFGNMGGMGGVFEHFGQGKTNNLSTETLLQIILFILIALFIIQLVECLYVRCTE